MIKRILCIVVCAFMLSSCGIFIKGYQYIGDYNDQMAILQLYFPEVYDLYCYGEVIIDEVYSYVDDYGTTQYHISYHYR